MINAVLKSNLSQNIDALKINTQKQVLRKAVRNAAAIVRQAVKAAIPSHFKRRTGALLKSIGTKVKTYQQTVIGVVGPRKAVVRELRGKAVKPSKYFQILHNKKPFLMQVFNSVQAAYKSKLIEVIKQELPKYIGVQ